MEKIELQLLAIDFKDTTFTGYPCAIEKAVKRQLGLEGDEWIEEFYLGDIKYLHEYYGKKKFDVDQSLASMLTDEEIVRVITLTKV